MDEKIISAGDIAARTYVVSLLAAWPIRGISVNIPALKASVEQAGYHLLISLTLNKYIWNEVNPCPARGLALWIEVAGKGIEQQMWLVAGIDKECRW
ncbi:hypothetical protein [Devosia lacusdianchii]|uniref:hypothetical protein n=1 Tax=Devosia lacusdianchii TaxID=2917991 RepID=UPI001F060224|nr:hypothetical protein [Devosia sp. JXJ CY 41]